VDHLPEDGTSLSSGKLLRTLPEAYKNLPNLHRRVISTSTPIKFLIKAISGLAAIKSA